MIIHTGFYINSLKIIKEGMIFVINMVRYYSADINIMRASENIHVNGRIRLAQTAKQFFNFAALRTVRIGLCGNTARASRKFQPVILRPAYNIAFTYKIKGANKLNSLVILAFQPRKHRLHLRAVKHTHKRSLDNVVEMMSQCDLIAAEFLRSFIKPTAAKPRTQKAEVLALLCGRFKYTRREIFYGQFKLLGIFAYLIHSFRIIAGVHYYVFSGKRYLSIHTEPFQTYSHYH